VRALLPNGRVVTLIGDGIFQGVALGRIGKAGVNMATGIAIAGDALYITDSQENAVLKLRAR
jgi:hypothetical protein